MGISEKDKVLLFIKRRRLDRVAGLILLLFLIFPYQNCADTNGAFSKSLVSSSQGSLNPPPAPSPTPPPPPPPPPPPQGQLPAGITAPFPTMKSISLEWALGTGDSNNNSVVNVEYRKDGTSTWQNGMPLKRVPAGSYQTFSWVNKHSGSLFDLEAATTYEIRLTRTDPDTSGSVVETFKVSTRAYPAPMFNAPVKTVAAGTNLTTYITNNVVAGDIVELSPGTYSGFTVSKNGTAGKPIVIRAQNAGTVTINGRILLDNRSYIHIENLNVNAPTNLLPYQGAIQLSSSAFVSITGNTVVNSLGDIQGNGIESNNRSENLYIADNTVIGKTAWNNGTLGVNGANGGEGIQVTGPGHVIEFNRVRGFRDCISFHEDAEAADQYSIDVLNNDIEIGADDGIEADFCFHNCRVMRNRIVNSFMGISSQPSLGGPTYFIRNVMYNVLLHAFKLHRESTGDVILHNTIVKSGDALSVYAGVQHKRQYLRNNLFIGGPGGIYNGYDIGSGAVISMDYAEWATYDSNYNGYGSENGAFTGRIATVSFNGLQDLKNKTTEKNAVQVYLNSVFATSVAYPSNGMNEYAFPNLQLGSSSNARDAGVVIPNITDGSVGAPDLGAYEYGVQVPAYGPR